MLASQYAQCRSLLQALPHAMAQAELEALRASLEQASSAGSELAAEWRGRAEAANREVAAVRDRARALMEEKDSETSVPRARGSSGSIRKPCFDRHAEPHSAPSHTPSPCNVP